DAHSPSTGAGLGPDTRAAQAGQRLAVDWGGGGACARAPRPRDAEGRRAGRGPVWWGLAAGAAPPGPEWGTIGSTRKLTAHSARFVEVCVSVACGPQLTAGRSASIRRRRGKKYTGISPHSLVGSSAEVTMQTITITLSDDRLAQLQELAVRF